MKRILMIATLVLTMLALVASPALAKDTVSSKFNARLTGAAEVPPRATDAFGKVSIGWSEDRTAFRYILSVSSIENVVAAHIHCAPAGVNGPVGVTLYSGGVPGGGAFDGILAQGKVSAPDAGNSCGWTTMQDVYNAMSSGNTYVNVHTNDGVDGSNTGPGDFAAGEIRGQLR